MKIQPVAAPLLQTRFWKSLQICDADYQWPITGSAPFTECINTTTGYCMTRVTVRVMVSTAASYNMPHLARASKSSTEPSENRDCIKTRKWLCGQGCQHLVQIQITLQPTRSSRLRAGILSTDPAIPTIGPRALANGTEKGGLTQARRHTRSRSRRAYRGDRLRLHRRHLCHRIRRLVAPQITMVKMRITCSRFTSS